MTETEKKDAITDESAIVCSGASGASGSRSMSDAMARAQKKYHRTAKYAEVMVRYWARIAEERKIEAERMSGAEEKNG